MEKYYVSGCIELEGTVGHVEDDTAEFFTLYEKKENGQSHALLDCVDRLSVEAAMAVYIERDALQEQVRALAAENASMKLSLETQDVSDELQDLLNDTVQLDSDSDGCQSWTWVDNADKVILTILGAIKPKTPVTDAILREIRAQGAIDARNALVVAGDGADIYAVLSNVAARIRAGEQP